MMSRSLSTTDSRTRYVGGSAEEYSWRKGLHSEPASWCIYGKRVLLFVAFVALTPVAFLYERAVLSIAVVPFVVLAVVLAVVYSNEDDEGSTWGSIPSWQYDGVYVHNGGLTREEQEESIREIQEKADGKLQQGRRDRR